MQFNERIMHIMDKPRDGSKERLSLAEYAELGDDRKRYYAPLYAKYRTKKVRDYDPDCGHFVGWRPIQVGVGEPVAYEHVGYFAARMIDSLYSSNVLTSRIIGIKPV